MDKIEYILCHGSGNRFLMLDAVARDLSALQTSEFVQKVCHGIEIDGVLFLNRHSSGLYAMRMFNTDGSEAEMCGNGIRCVARRVSELYEQGQQSFTMVSGDKQYPICHEEQIASGVETFSVEIGISTSSPDFLLSSDRFVGKRIEALDSTQYFTYLNLGNPHIVTLCDEIDLEKLSVLGERVKKLSVIFPHGVNVSQMKYIGEQEIYVATFERGVGLTPSCGTAMTASCTAATLLGVCRDERQVKVRNRGGVVYCTTSLSGGNITTKLTGNATFESCGLLSPNGEILSQELIVAEREAWANFIMTLE